MVWEVVCGRLCGVGGSGRYVTPHSNPCRLKQTSEWSAQAFHEGSLCGAMSHCTCSAEVWSIVLITNPSPHTCTHVSCFIFHVHHIITTHPLYPPPPPPPSLSGSSLLPYLHMLMDPLVSALNGSQTLISQGLRTLELCVDNLQPDFLYEHIQPVRAELMQVGCVASGWSLVHYKGLP